MSIGVSLTGSPVASTNATRECGGVCFRSSLVYRSELGASLRLSSAVSSVKTGFSVRAAGKNFHNHFISEFFHSLAICECKTTSVF